MAVFAVSTVAQAPQGPPPETGRPPRSYPTPTNLKALPKTLTGQQVHDIMEGWSGALGVHCDLCHAKDGSKIAPNGRPALKFEDDSKPDKDTARMMYTMTQDIKKNYIDSLETTGPDVSCGTCHRGKKVPEAYVPPPENGAGPPSGLPSPPAAGTPPAPAH
jgi:hypothetical protein